MDSREEATKRNRITLYLLLAGGAVLLIPLLVLFYLRSTEASSPNPDAASHPFAPRERVGDRIKAAQTPAPAILPPNTLAGAAGPAQTQNAASASVSDSLGFIKGGSDYLPVEQTSTESAKSEAPPTPAPKQEVAKSDPAPQAKSKPKSGPKTFMQPHLKGSGFGGNNQRGGQMGQRGQMGQMPTGSMPQMPSGAGMPDMSKMMQGMMPGAGSAGGTGMPDMSKMMQGMMPAGAGAAPAAGTTQTK